MRGELHVAHGSVGVQGEVKGSCELRATPSEVVATMAMGTRRANAAARRLPPGAAQRTLFRGEPRAPTQRHLMLPQGWFMARLMCHDLSHEGGEESYMNKRMLSPA